MGRRALTTAETSRRSPPSRTSNSSARRSVTVAPLSAAASTKTRAGVCPAATDGISHATTTSAHDTRLLRATARLLLRQRIRPHLELHHLALHISAAFV